MTQRLLSCLVLVSLVSFQGCTHQQLRDNTVNHSKTVADVHTQQVLDNLAKFVANPHALPHFEYPNQGGSDVSDTIRGNSSFSFTPQALSGWGFGVDGTRNSKEAFTMTPVNDPRKLELMRCAYQRAVSSCCYCYGESAGCPNCDKRFNKFYFGQTGPPKRQKTTAEGKPIFLLVAEPTKEEVDSSTSSENEQLDCNSVAKNDKTLPAGIEVFPETNELGQTYYRCVEDPQNVILTPEEAKLSEIKTRLKEVYESDSLAKYTNRTGVVTAACLGGPCWFHVGEKSLVPDLCKECGFVGEYCGTCVWVPESGRDQLTKLTLTILDIALNDPPKSNTKEVVAFLDVNRDVTSKENAAYKVTATIPINAPVTDVVPGAKSSKLNILRIKQELSKIEAELEESKNMLALVKPRLTNAVDVSNLAEKNPGLRDELKFSLNNSKQIDLSKLSMLNEGFNWGDNKPPVVDNWFEKYNEAIIKNEMLKSRKRLLEKELEAAEESYENSGTATPSGLSDTVQESPNPFGEPGSNLLQLDQSLRFLAE
ncbi:MAG: hypothetical protein KDA65_00970 [Planctomycetaceae bacterium]|nr:hypothetical protein [Planctomycetaceae bacterium]